jgi:hypothetical protein
MHVRPWPKPEGQASLRPKFNELYAANPKAPMFGIDCDPSARRGRLDSFIDPR